MKAAKTDLLRKIIMPVLAVVVSLALGAVIIAEMCIRDSVVPVSWACFAILAAAS